MHIGELLYVCVCLYACVCSSVCSCMCVCVQGCMQNYASMSTRARGEALVLLLRHCPLSFSEAGSLTDLERIKTDEAGQGCPGNRFHLPPQCWD